MEKYAIPLYSTTGRKRALSFGPQGQASSMLDENSVPGKNWSTFQCIIKRICNTYKAARLELKAMENVTDTEEEVTQVIQLQQENDVVLNLNHIMQVDDNIVTPITEITSDNAMVSFSLTLQEFLHGLHFWVNIKMAAEKRSIQSLVLIGINVCHADSVFYFSDGPFPQ